MPSCDSGLGSPHPADHAETLTPPIAHRTSASHLAQSVYPQTAMPVASTANSGKYRFQTCPAHRQGFASPARLTAYFLSLRHFSENMPNDNFTLSRTANLQFPDALMSRHDAGEQAVAHQKLFPCPLCRPMIRNGRLSRSL